MDRDKLTELVSNALDQYNHAQAIRTEGPNHPAGAVMDAIWPEIERQRILLDQFCNVVVNTGMVEPDNAQDQFHHEDVAGLWMTARELLDGS